jgi:hypothetical protein
MSDIEAIATALYAKQRQAPTNDGIDDVDLRGIVYTTVADTALILSDDNNLTVEDFTP